MRAITKIYGEEKEYSVVLDVDGTDENDGLVVEELQKGFYLGEKILRPARVKIARKKAEPKPKPEAQKEEKEENPEGEEEHNS